MGRGGGPKVGNFINQRGAGANSNAGGGVPENIKCQTCKKMKSKDQYANRQLLKFSSYNKTAARNPAAVLVTCKTCTPGQTTELTCYLCDNTKGLDLFAKNQRKDPDKARCIDCVKKVLETEPDMSPPDSDESEAEEDTDDEDWGTGTKAPIRKTSYNATPTAPSLENRAPQFTAPSIASSAANAHAAMRSSAPNATSSIDGDGNAWETVDYAGAPPAKYGVPWGSRVNGSSAASSSSRSTSTHRVAPQNTKSNGWAKVSKVGKGKEQKWGEGNAAEYSKEEEEEVDVWAKYSRDIRDSKESKTSKQKKPNRARRNEDF